RRTTSIAVAALDLISTKVGGLGRPPPDRARQRYKSTAFSFSLAANSPSESPDDSRRSRTALASSARQRSRAGIRNGTRPREVERGMVDLRPTGCHDLTQRGITLLVDGLRCRRRTWG